MLVVTQIYTDRAAVFTALRLSRPLSPHDVTYTESVMCCTHCGWSNNGDLLLIGSLDQLLGLVLRYSLSNDGYGAELCVQVCVCVCVCVCVRARACVSFTLSKVIASIVAS